MAERSGVVIERTPIVVDRWVKTEGARLFFLTHAHTDHTQGLHKRWCWGQIFCTEITKKLVQLWYGFPDDMFVILVVGESHRVQLDNVGAEYMMVTAFDANHCPGAVMYLFEGYFGTILCTGDFRYSKELHDPLASYEIDRVFLDNTYLYNQYECPPRTEATQLMLRIIRQHPRHKVYIGLTNIGKEALLEAIYTEFGEVVKVSNERALVLSACGIKKCVFTSDFRSTSRFVAVPQAELSSIGKTFESNHPKHARNSTGTSERLDRNPSPDPHSALMKDEALICGADSMVTERPAVWGKRTRHSTSHPTKQQGILRIRPSGFLPFAPTTARKTFAELQNTRGREPPLCGSIKYIPYSDHSTRQELIAFIAKIRPVAITPIVRSTLGNIDVLRPYCRTRRDSAGKNTQSVLASTSAQSGVGMGNRGVIPLSVKEFMMGSVANAPTKRGWGECGRNAFEHLQHCYAESSPPATASRACPAASRAFPSLAELHADTTVDTKPPDAPNARGKLSSCCTSRIGTPLFTSTAPIIIFDEPPKRIRLDNKGIHSICASDARVHPKTRHSGLVAMDGTWIKPEPDSAQETTVTGSREEIAATDDEDADLLAMYISLAESSPTPAPSTSHAESESYVTKHTCEGAQTQHGDSAQSMYSGYSDNSECTIAVSMEDTSSVYAWRNDGSGGSARRTLSSDDEDCAAETEALVAMYQSLHE